jgi:hypothetical protein
MAFGGSAELLQSPLEGTKVLLSFKTRILASNFSISCNKDALQRQKGYGKAVQENV